MWDFYYEGKVKNIVVSCIYKLFQVTELGCSMQDKLTHVRSLS
jgi:hypothetical protein